MNIYFVMFSNVCNQFHLMHALIPPYNVSYNILQLSVGPFKPTFSVSHCATCITLGEDVPIRDTLHATFLYWEKLWLSRTPI